MSTIIPKYTDRLVNSSNFWVEAGRGRFPDIIEVHKFGRNTAVADGTWEMVSNLSGSYPWPAAATTVRVKAGGNIADIATTGAGARTIRVYGIDSNGDDANEVLDLNGADASSPTTTSFWRVYRAVVETCGTYATPYNTAAIIIENSAGSADLIKIEASESQSQLCSFSVPSGWTGYLLGIAAQVDANKPADLRVMSRENITDTTGDVSPIRLRHYADGIKGEYVYEPHTPMLSLTGPADIWVEAEGSGAATEVSADFEMICIKDEDVTTVTDN